MTRAVHSLTIVHWLTSTIRCCRNTLLSCVIQYKSMCELRTTISDGSLNL